MKKVSSFIGEFMAIIVLIIAALAPLLTPALTYLYLRTSVDVDVKAMFISIIEVVLVPIGLGILINKVFGKYLEKVRDALPAISVTAICLIVAVVSHNSERILTTGAILAGIFRRIGGKDEKK